jgi:hypothetical protein
MVDIETLGLDAGAAILSIGAVRFDSDGPTGDEFYREVSLESCQEAGLEVDAQTLEWWLEQDEAARDALTGGQELADVLELFADWYGDADEVWANSPSFDCALLEAAFTAAGSEIPWTFKHERDVRTVAALDLVNEPDHDGVEHHALDDAAHQARYVAKALRELDRTASVGEPELSDDSDDHGTGPDVPSAEEDLSGGDLGIYHVKDYALVLNQDVQDHFEDLGAERATVRERDGRLELAPGESDEWPDYALSSAGIQVGSPGQDVLGVDAGDMVRARADGDVVVLEVLDEDGQELDDATVTEEDVVDELEESPDVGEDDEHRIGDELDDVEDQEASADGGAVEVQDDPDVQLPDGVTAEDVHEAVDELAPKPYLGEVADEIGVDRDRARTIVFQLDRYSDCVDAAEYTRGGD